VLSAGFAALTAIFAKVGVENVNADFATFIRTIVILATLAFILLATGHFQSSGEISSRSYLFLLLSGLAAGASWACCRQGRADRQALAGAGGAVRCVFLARLTAPDWFGVALIAAGAVLVAYR
jgi:transporter family protein